MQDRSFLEKCLADLQPVRKNYRLPFLSALIAGLGAYLFCFTNKLEIMDDLACMFAQGSTLASGRWGLDLVKYITPGISLPWLNGFLSLLLLSGTSCLTLHMFRIKNPLLRILLPAVLITFPSQTCTFAYMFTTTQYALALLLAVWGAYGLSKSKNLKSCIVPCILLVLSMSMYQPYIAVTASWLVIYVLLQVLQGEEKPKQSLLTGLRFLLCLGLSLLAYRFLTLLIQKGSGTALGEYGSSTLNGVGDLLFGIRVAYTSFIGYFYKGYYDLVPTTFSTVVHAAAGLITCILLTVRLVRFSSPEERKGRALLVLLCLLLLPPAVNAMRIISSLTHNLMLFSVTAVYVLAAVVLEQCVPALKETLRGAAKDLVAICLFLTAAINIVFANSVYLQMYMKVQQAEAFYTTVLACLMQEENFTADAPVAFVGSNDILYEFPMIETDNLAGIREGILGTYSQSDFIRYFLGVELNICGWDVTDLLQEDERVLSMPSYPSAGSIRQLDGIYVVRLG